MKPVLRIDRLKVHFPGKKFPLFTEVTFEIPEGSVFGLFGHTGSGKSTIGKIICGFFSKTWYQGKITFTSGEVEYNLNSLSEEDFRKNIRGKKIVYVPQDPYQVLNPYETIQAGLNRISHSRDKWEIILKQLDFPINFVREYPGALSAGQRQRVILAMAFMTEAELLILDEPAASIDESGREVVVRIIKEYVKNGKTILIISHEIEELGDLFQEEKCFFLTPKDKIDVVSKKKEYAKENTALLFLEGVRKSYDGWRVLDRISLELKRGEWIYLEGPNGAGKSTLLNILAGRIKPENGNLYWEKTIIPIENWFKRTAQWIHLIPQDHEGDLNPRWNIGKSVDEATEKIPDQLKNRIQEKQNELWIRFGLVPELRAHLPCELSYGQQKRAVIVRGLLKYFKESIINPECGQLLLLDEIFSGIHIGMREEIFRYFIEESQKPSAPTVLWIAHGYKKLRSQCDRHLYIRGGKIWS